MSARTSDALGSGDVRKLKSPSALRRWGSSVLTQDAGGHMLGHMRSIFRRNIPSPSTAQDLFIVTVADLPDWSDAFDGEVSTPLGARFRGPLLTAACWSAYYAEGLEYPTTDPKGIARLCARAISDIENIPAEDVIRVTPGLARRIQPQGGGGWRSDTARGALYAYLKQCQAADSIEQGQLDAWSLALTMAHVVGVVEARS